MAFPFGRILLAGTVFLLCASAAFAAEPTADRQFVYWQNRLLGKESGVYVDGDSVYVHVRMPIDPKARLRLKGMAMQEFSAQLRRWALEQTRRDRGGEPSRPAAVARMAAFNDEADPDWRFPPWRVAIGGRQFPSREAGGFFVQGQVYNKESLLKAIPDSYRRQPTNDEVLSAFARNAAAAHRKDKAAFAAWCGFFERPLLSSRDPAVFPDPEDRHFPKQLESFLVDARSADAGKAAKEWEALNKTFASSLSQSSVCSSFAGGRPVTNETVSAVVVTNSVVETVCSTNIILSVLDGTDAGVAKSVVTSETVTNYVAETVVVTNRTVSFVRDESDRLFLSAGLLRRAPVPLVFAPASPAADATAETIRVALRRAPTDPRLWKALAARYKADGNPALSLACLLEALSLTPSDTDIVAEIALRYDALGCPGLAQGAALFAFGAAKDAETRQKVKPLLAE